MGLPLESAPALNPPVDATAGRIVAGRPMDEWNEAYVKIERYFAALGVKNKLLLGQLVMRVLDRAMDRAPREPEASTMQLSAEEMDHVVVEWYAAVLDEPKADPLLRTRGRLALLLADMPGRWQDQFLRPGPWPEEFVGAMRESFLRAGPDFQVSIIAPRPIDLGPITTLTNLSNLPYFRMILAWAAFAGILMLIFEATH